MCNEWSSLIGADRSGSIIWAASSSFPSRLNASAFKLWINATGLQNHGVLVLFEMLVAQVDAQLGIVRV